MSLETDRIEADINESRSKLNTTLDELGNKLSPGQIASNVAGMAKAKTRQIAGGAARRVQSTPLPYILIGAGVALLVLNRNKKSHQSVSADDWSSDRHYRSIEEARWATPRLPNETDDAYNERVHEAYAGALGMKQKAGEALNDFKARVSKAVEGVKHAATGARERIGKTLTGATHAASDGARYVGTKATSGARYVGDRANSGVRSVGEKATEARHQAEHLYETNPLAIAGVALGIGALIGALAPLSRTERQSLRGVADQARQRGEELAERGVRLVEERVQSATGERSGANSGMGSTGDGSIH